MTPKYADPRRDGGGRGPLGPGRGGDFAAGPRVDRGPGQHQQANTAGGRGRSEGGPGPAPAGGVAVAAVNVKPKLTDLYKIQFKTSTAEGNDKHTCALHAISVKDEIPVWMKVGYNEDTKKRVRREINTLLFLTNKKRIDKLLKNSKVSIPVLIDYKINKAKDVDLVDYLVIQDNNYETLEHIHVKEYAPTKNRFSKSMLGKIGLHMVEILQYLHGCGYIHRFIDPQNVVVKGNLNDDDGNYQIELIDFAGARKFKHTVVDKDEVSSEEHIKEKAIHVPVIDNRPAISNHIRSYCAANKDHRNFSRKDDMEQLALMLLALSRCCLPWHMPEAFGKREEYIEKYYSDLPLERAKELGLHGIVDLLSKCEEMEFHEEPDYDAWKKVFKQMI